VLAERQKQVLIEIYQSFRREAGGAVSTVAPVPLAAEAAEPPESAIGA